MKLNEVETNGLLESKALMLTISFKLIFSKLDASFHRIAISETHGDFHNFHKN